MSLNKISLIVTVNTIAKEKKKLEKSVFSKVAVTTSSLLSSLFWVLIINYVNYENERVKLSLCE